jgi:hypothetical protein
MLARSSGDKSEARLDARSLVRRRERSEFDARLLVRNESEARLDARWLVRRHERSEA